MFLFKNKVCIASEHVLGEMKKSNGNYCFYGNQNIKKKTNFKNFYGKKGVSVMNHHI